MGVTDPNGDPYSEAAALDDWPAAEEVESWATFEVEDEHLEGLETPTLAIAIRTASGETVTLASIKEPLAGEWQLDGPGPGVADD